MAKDTPATLAERIARLRTDLLSSDEGRKAIIQLSATGSVQADQDIVAAWPQSWPQTWGQGWGQYAPDEEEGDWGQYAPDEEEGDWGQHAEVDEEQELSL